MVRLALLQKSARLLRKYLPSAQNNDRKNSPVEFIALLYTYNLIVSNKVKYLRTRELKNLFYNRMAEKKAFFQKNELIKSNYEFVRKIIESFF